jgi:hypothetical protein
VTPGCGSDQSGSRPPDHKPGTIKLDPKDDFTYEGTGRAKRKVELDRRERVRRLHEAAKKAE